MDRRRIALTLVAIVAATPRATAGQVIAGQVLDDDTGDPIVGAELIVLNHRGEPRVRGVSDTSGGFLIQITQEGEYALRVSHLGYAAYTSEPVWVERDRAVDVQVRLGVEAIPLEPMTVLARRGIEEVHLSDFNRRRLNPGRVGGHFVTREDIDRRPNATPSQLLLGVPGVTLQRLNNANAFALDRSVIRMSSGRGGGCRAHVYVDGSPVQQAAGASIDDLLDQSLIAGVEVYPRPLNAPIDYQMHSDCGVVLFWTRRPGAGRRPPSVMRYVAGGGAVLGLFLFAFSQVIG